MRTATWLTLAGLALACTAAEAGPPPLAAPPAPAPQVLIDPNDPNDPNLKRAAAAPAEPPPDPAQLAKGLGMYKDYCQKCHGVDMVSPGGSFFDLRAFPHDDKARFVSSVKEGKRAMPAWGGVLKGEEIDLLWAYVRSGGAK